MTLLSRNSLLLLIDLQKAIDDPRWGDRNNPQAEANIVQLLAAWRQSQMPVLHVKHMSTEPDSPYRPGQTGDLGFTTLVVADATFTFGRADFDGTWHPAAAVHAMSLANLSGEYATILSTEEILQQLPLLA
ncbi:hypothetical protein [Sphaerothrix gracilis]|uniref:hypothetical protein n=1 Tax=Sphaerothrix gracilis TaxID=3151835 RepID=UPI0031FC8A4F